MKQVCIPALLALLLAGCDSEVSTEPAPNIEFNVQNANSIAITSDGEAFTIDENEFQTLTVNRKVSDFKVIDDLYYFEVINTQDYENGKLSYEYYQVDKNDKWYQMPFSKMPLASNDDGDLIFRNFEIFRVKEQRMDKLNINVDGAIFQTISGNFIVIRSGDTYQIFDTSTGYRLNVEGCNGPRLLSVSSSAALVDDCKPDELLLDVESNTRSKSELKNLWGEAIYLGEGKGSYVVNYDDELNNFIYHVDRAGLAEQFPTDSLNVDGECMNCDNLVNDYLFGSEEYVVIKEPDSVIIYDVLAGAQRRILDGLDILSIDIYSDTLVYIAENTKGKILYGKNNLSTGYAYVEGQTKDFVKIHAVN